MAARVLAGVEEAIRRSDAFIVLISQSGARSFWVEAELEAALRVLDTGEKSKVIAVLLDDAPLPTALHRHQALHVRNNDWDAVAENLVETSVGGPLPERRLEDEVEAVLGSLGVEFEREPVSGGVRPDFLLEQDGLRLVLEVKAWYRPGVVDAMHGLNQLSRMIDALGADYGLLVVSELQAFPAAENVVSIETLPDAIRRWQQDVSSRSREAQPETSPPRQIFAAMPFAPEYSDTYWVGMVEAAKAVGAGCVRTDEEDYEGDVVEQIKEDIKASSVVIADLSDSAPNVLFELGFAHALDKPCIHICSSPLDELPFDVRNWSTLAYGKGRTHQLKDELVRKLKKLL